MRKQNAWVKLLAMAAFAVLVALPIFRYQNSIHEDLKQRAYTMLGEVASEQGETVTRWVAAQHNLLGAFAQQVNPAQQDDAKLQQQLQGIRDNGGFLRAWAADVSGNALDDAGQRQDCAQEPGFRRGLGGAWGTSFARENGETVIALTVPIVQEGRVLGVLGGVIRAQSLAGMLHTEAFGGQGYLAVADRTGQVIARSQRGAMLLTGDNLLEFFAAASLDDDTTYDEIAASLQHGARTMFHYSYEGSRRYICSLPLGLSDWQLFAAVPVKLVEEEYAFITRRTTELMLSLSFVFGVVMLFVFWMDRGVQRELLLDSERLRQSEERYRLMEELTESVMFEMDLGQQLITFNSNYTKVYGQAAPAISMAPHVDPHPHIYREDWPLLLSLWESIQQGRRDNLTADLRVVDAEGDPVWSHIDAMVLENAAGQPVKVIGKLSNIEQRMKQLEQLRSMVGQDSLTKLHNRKAVMNEVSSHLAGSGSKGMHAFFMVDIDDFKLINDTFGHYEGDCILIAAAERMRDIFRSSDIIGRMGGDEFAVFLKNIGTLDMARQKAAELRRVMCDLTRENGQPAGTSCSIGISVCQGAEYTFDQLYKMADYALYEAKRGGKNSAVVYSGGLEPGEAAEQPE